MEEDEEEGKLHHSSKHYMTPFGADLFRKEYQHLMDEERPKLIETINWAAGNGDRSENGDYIYGKRRLREIDRRIRFLTHRLEDAEIIDPATISSDSIRFGATVIVRDEEGQEKTYAIVGIDETDGEKGRISWVSPLGKALLKKKVGDVITFQRPKGDIELEVVRVEYIPIEW